MPKFSAFTPFGQLRYSSKPSRFKQVYDAMKLSLVRGEGQAQLDLASGSEVEADLYATARCIAAAEGLVEKAGNQANPNKVLDLLPNMERDYLVAPNEDDSIEDRRATLAARKRLPGGAKWSNVWNALSDLLGDDFYTYVALQDYDDRYPLDPAASTQVNAQLESVPARVARLTEAIGITGSAVWVGYETATDADVEAVLLAGESVMVQPENTGLSERVSVTAVRTTGTLREFQATFTKAHDEGAIVTTQSWPWQFSVAHHHYVVVTTTCARDPVKRARIDDLMARLMRAPSTWSIVEPTSVTQVGSGPVTAVTVGPTTVTSIIGAVSVAAATYQI